MRCPICGGPGTPWHFAWERPCFCTGAGLRFWASRERLEDRHLSRLEPLRRKYVERGFGWSWFIPKRPPVLVLGED